MPRLSEGNISPYSESGRKGLGEGVGVLSLNLHEMDDDT